MPAAGYRVALCAAFAVLTAAVLGAQSRPSFSGRWVLTSRPVAGPTELTIVHSATSLTVEHLATASACPKATTYPLSGIVRGEVRRDGSVSRSQDAFWFGHELIIPATSEKWSLDAAGRLVIECTERRSGTDTKVTTLAYRKR